MNKKGIPPVPKPLREYYEGNVGGMDKENHIRLDIIMFVIGLIFLSITITFIYLESNRPSRPSVTSEVINVEGITCIKITDNNIRESNIICNWDK